MKTKTQELLRETFGGDWSRDSRVARVVEYIDQLETKLQVQSTGVKQLLMAIETLSDGQPGIQALVREALREL